MGQSRDLFRNTLIYTIGNFGSKILIFLLLPIFSFYLTRSDLGIYDIVVTAVSFFVPFVTLQISNAAYRWLLMSGQKNVLNRKKIISSAFFLVTLGLIIFQSVYHLVGYFLDLRYTFYVSILVITSSYLPFFQNIIRGLGKLKLYSLAGLINAFFLLSINAYFLVVLELGLEALFIAMILANTLTIIFILLYGKLFNYIKLVFFDCKKLKEMLGFSIPLVPNVVSWWLINAADKFLILYILTSEMNGIYAISSRFPTILILFNSVFILAWQDHTITAKVEGKSEYDSKIFDKYVNFQFSLVLILIAVSEPLVRYTVDEKFYEAYKFMPLLFIGAAFSSFAGYFGAAFLREKNTKGIFTSSIMGGIVNLIITFSLMKYIGLYASALGTFLSFLLMFIMRIHQSKKFFLIKINYSKFVGLAFLSVIFSILILYNNFRINILLLLISLIIFFLLNKNMILKIFKIAKVKLNIQ